MDWWLPKPHPLIQVECTSVFHPGKTISHSLSNVELARVLDVPVAYHAIFSSWPAHHRSVLPFLRSTPGKVLFYISNHVFGKGNHWLNEFSSISGSESVKLDSSPSVGLETSVKEQDVLNVASSVSLEPPQDGQSFIPEGLSDVEATQPRFATVIHLL